MAPNACIACGAWCTVLSDAWGHAGEYQLDLAFDNESCILITDFTVDCKDGYSKEGYSKVCSQQCDSGHEVKVKEGSCEIPELKASIKSKMLDIGYLKKQTQHLQPDTDSQSRTIQVEPSANFGVSNLTHTKHIGQGLDSWVKLGHELTNQSGAKPQSLHYFLVYFDAAGIPDSTELTATLTFSGMAWDYDEEAASGKFSPGLSSKAVADNITLQARVPHIFMHAYKHVYHSTGSRGLCAIVDQIQDGA